MFEFFNKILTEQGLAVAIILLLLVGIYKFGKDIAKTAVNAYSKLIASLIQRFINDLDDASGKIDVLTEHVDKLSLQVSEHIKEIDIKFTDISKSISSFAKLLETQSKTK